MNVNFHFNSFLQIIINSSVCVLSCLVVSDSFATPWIIACQAPLSMGFPRQEELEGIHFLLQGHLLDPGTEL